MLTRVADRLTISDLNDPKRSAYPRINLDRLRLPQTWAEPLLKEVRVKPCVIYALGRHRECLRHINLVRLPLSRHSFPRFARSHACAWWANARRPRGRRGTPRGLRSALGWASNATTSGTARCSSPRLPPAATRDSREDQEGRIRSGAAVPILCVAASVGAYRSVAFSHNQATSKPPFVNTKIMPRSVPRRIRIRLVHRWPARFVTSAWRN